MTAHRTLKLFGMMVKPAGRSLSYLPTATALRLSPAPALLAGMKRTMVIPDRKSKPPTQILEPVQAKAENQSEIKHDFVHFKTSTNVHPLGIKKVHEKFGGEFHHCVNHKHAIWTKEELEVKETHTQPGGIADWIAFAGVKTLRTTFDVLSGYRFGKLTENKVLYRAIFLETVAGVPGMTAGMLRHLRSLRRMDRDHGWIHTLLEEAENERMHLMTFIQLKKPGILFRLAVIATQGVFMPIFAFMYMVHPHLCHRFVGYLEEEAVHTYASILEAIEDGRLGKWQTERAPQIAIDYWKMSEDATMKDLIMAVRADEANHRDVNHTFATLKLDQDTPFDEDGKLPKATPDKPAQGSHAH